MLLEYGFGYLSDHGLVLSLADGLWSTSMILHNLDLLVDVLLGGLDFLLLAHWVLLKVFVDDEFCESSHIPLSPRRVVCLVITK